MEPAYVEYGVVGIFLLLLLKEIPNWIVKLKNGGATVEDKLVEEIRKVVEQNNVLIQELHGWHNVHDEDGVKIWYVRRSLHIAIEQLAKSVAKMSSVMELLERRLRTPDSFRRGTGDNK